MWDEAGTVVSHHVAIGEFPEPRVQSRSRLQHLLQCSMAACSPPAMFAEAQRSNRTGPWNRRSTTRSPSWG